MAVIAIAVGILITGNTFIAIIASNTDRRIIATALIREAFAGLACAIDTRWSVFAAVSITKTGHAGHTAKTEGLVAITACIVGLVTERTIAADTLRSEGIITIAITHAADTFGAAINTEGRVAPAARIIAHITEGTGIIDALLTATIRILGAR